MKKWVVALVAQVFALGLGFTAGVAQAKDASYNFSPLNPYDIQPTAAYKNPIFAYASVLSGVKLNLKIGQASVDTTGDVVAKEVEFAFSKHLISPEREQLGWKVFGRHDRPALRGQIVVAADYAAYKRFYQSATASLR